MGRPLTKSFFIMVVTERVKELRKMIEERNEKGWSLENLPALEELNRKYLAILLGQERTI